MRIGIWSPSEIIREGVKSLAGKAGWDVVWEHGTATFPPTTEDVNLVIAAFAKTIEVATALRGGRNKVIEMPQTMVIVASGETIGGPILEMLFNVGVLGIIPIGAASEAFHACASAAGAGSFYVDFTVTPYRTFADFLKERQGRNDAVTLTAREREILTLIAQSASIKEIAAQLEIGKKTVEAHKFNLMRKLNIHDKSAIVRYAIREGFVTIAEMPVAS